MTEDTQVYELVTTAFSRDRMTLPVTEIERRALRRRGRWVPVVAGLIVVAMLAGFSWWQGLNRTRLATLDGLTAECMRHWTQLQPSLPEKVNRERPDKIFSLGTGASHAARIYSNGEVLLECLREGDSIRAGSFYFDNGQSPFGRTSNELRYFGHYGELSYLVGDMPKGMTAVAARLTNGDMVQAEVAGNLFALWHPHASLIGAVLTASGPQDQVRAEHPTNIGGIRDEASLDATCRSQIADEYDGHPVTGLHLIYSRDLPEFQFRAYLSDWTLVECTADRLPTTAVLMGAGWIHRQWSQMGPLEHVGLGSIFDMFYFGRAPDNATRVELHLTDGTLAQAELVNGYFCVLFSRPQATHVAKVVGYTPTTIYTRENHVTTTSPR